MDECTPPKRRKRYFMPVKNSRIMRILNMSNEPAVNTTLNTTPKMPTSVVKGLQIETKSSKGKAVTLIQQTTTTCTEYDDEKQNINVTKSSNHSGPNSETDEILNSDEEFVIYSRNVLAERLRTFSASTNVTLDTSEKTSTPLQNYEGQPEVEEPFSPVVSEYVPSTDSSESEEEVCAIKEYKKRISKQRKIFLQDTQRELNTPPLYIENASKYKAEIAQSYAIANSVSTKFTTEKTVKPISKDNFTNCAITPCTSYPARVAISTPDSFREILKFVRNKEQALVPYGTITQNKNLKHRAAVKMTNQSTYRKFHFVASLFTVYENWIQANEPYGNSSNGQNVSVSILQQDLPEDYESSNDSESLASHINVTSTTRSSSTTNIDFIASQLTVYVNDDINIANEEKPTKRLSRKRVRDESSWKVNKNKLLKNSGKRYHSLNTNIERMAKVMGDPCGCKQKCPEKIDNSERQAAFQSFWGLKNHERQWDYILRFVKTKPIRLQLANAKNPKTQTLEYTLPKKPGAEPVIVCKKMFLQTLSIGDKTVYNALDKQENGTIVDLRGTHTNRPTRIDELTKKSVIDHINSFPRKESHYLRKQTQREYLEETLNQSKMYRLYLEWVKEKPEFQSIKHVKYRYYCFLFNTHFNLGFFHPKKDLCEICVLFEQADRDRKDQLREEYEAHIRNKELIRNIKDEEKAESNNKEKTVACFDLEKVLSLPQSEVGIFHYKRKYPVYNFTVYNILTKQGYCYLWHAQIAKRGANEIGSCLWVFMQNEAAKGIKEISFYSDNCTGQNRNRFIFALYSYASKNLKIKITHRFLQKGHTQNEGDSMHSNVEKSKKDHVIYVPDQMYGYIRNAKVTGPKYNVTEMTQTQFYNCKELVVSKNWEKDITGAKVSWSKVKELSITPDCPEEIKIKYEHFETEPKIVNTKGGNRRNKKRKEVADRNLTLLYSAPLPISENLYKDLLSLCDGNHIPPHYQMFYRQLRPSATETEEDDN